MTLHHFARTAGMAALLAGVSTAAMAQSVNTLNNNQRNWAQVRADLNATVTSVTEDVTATAAAIGNSYSAELGGRTSLTNVQRNTQNVTSALDFTVEDAVGSISATSAAIANSASITIVDGSGTSTGNSQQWANNFRNVYATVDIAGANITGVDGLAAEVTAAAIANSLSVNAEGNLESINTQTFDGRVVSSLTANFTDVTGAANFTSASIANSASFDVTDAGLADITNTQSGLNGAQASSLIDTRDVTGSIESTTAAIGNSLSISTLPSTAVLTNANTQENRGPVTAMSNLDLRNVVGSVGLTAAAIANSASITNITQ